MRNMRITIGLIAAFGLLLVQNAVAAGPSPGAVVTAAAQAVKVKRSLVPLVDYVDWEWNYNFLEPQIRTARGFSSAKVMREHYLERLENNGEYVLQKIMEQQKAEKSKGENIDLTPVRKLKDELRRQRQTLLKRIDAISYIVVGEKIDGDEAVITVKKMQAGGFETGEVHARRTRGRWLLKSASFLNPTHMSPTNSSPVGAFLTPERALVQL